MNSDVHRLALKLEELDGMTDEHDLKIETMLEDMFVDSNGRFMVLLTMLFTFALSGSRLVAP